MRLLLGLDTVDSARNKAQRQQITPDMKFTCDGLITKWIVGARWSLTDDFYPELQVWRNVENNVYHKINGTFLNAQSINKIYKYEHFSPIPIQAGDVLGAFVPFHLRARLRLVSERDRGPTNYYVQTSNSATESPYGTIDIWNTPSLQSAVYHVLVTVEISEFCAIHCAHEVSVVL